MTPAQKLCRSCGVRWVQHPGGFCRHCYMQLFGTIGGCVESEALRVAAEQARLDALRPVLIPKTYQPFIKGGFHYTPIWDGRIRPVQLPS